MDNMNVPATSLRRAFHHRAACWLLPACLLAFSVSAQAPVYVPIAAATDIKNEALALQWEPNPDGTVASMSLLSTGLNWAGPGGLFSEGFGIANPYVPNRRINAWWDKTTDPDGREIYRYTYDCDGGNIAGLHVERFLDLIPGASSVRVTWRIVNRGRQAQWMAPWVRLPLTPGGTADAQDRFELPALDGILQARRAGYHPMARNWVAATDPTAKETWTAVFHADHLHSVLALAEREHGARGFHAALTPRLLEAGGSWETSYRLGVVRGLSHVNFAGGDFAAQLDYSSGKLVMLLAATRPMDNVQVYARILNASGKTFVLPGKQFSIDPMRLARCTYDWSAPEAGTYEFLAEVRVNGKPQALGGDLGSPHGGIDTQFVAGSGPAQPMAAWTDAPHALDRGARVLKRTLAANGPAQLWIDSSLEKIFSEDAIDAGSDLDPEVNVTLARNERESFQLALRPKKDLKQVQVQWGDLEHTGGGGRIPASSLACYVERFVPVRIPTHFEGPTGRFPDILSPYEPFSVRANTTAPLWFTLFAPQDTPPGNYLGRIEVSASGLDPVELSVEVKVHDFALPERPALKTDFHVEREAAMATAGGTAPAAMLAAYRDNALEHRITLREAAMLAWQERDTRTLARVSSVAVPPDALNDPARLAPYLKEPQQPGLFVPLADDPAKDAWGVTLDAAQRWKTAAPALPLMVRTGGLEPFLAQTVDIWAVHMPVFDTPIGEDIAEAIRQGKEVWGTVDRIPPRPYANFFLDFAAVEHRVLFWQLWALGVRGLHYWSVNHVPEGQDAFAGMLDTTPANGDGLLVYPGANGPVNSIRWEIIREGIEDYDYLAILQEHRRKLAAQGGHEALLARVDQAFDLTPVLSSLGKFERNPEVLLAKRLQIAAMIEETGKALR